MDHQEQHHEHHRKERGHEKHERKLDEHREEASLGSTIHPFWFIAVGAVLIVAVVLVWTYVL
jgi:hypothetical protein